MSMEEKLTTVCSQSDEIYAKGFQEGEDCGYQEGYTQGEAAGMEAGKQAEYDAFWDAYQDNGSRTGYNGAFSGEGWDDESFKPKYDIVPKKASCMFQYTRIKDIITCLNKAGVSLDCSKLTNASSMFYSCFAERLPRLDFSGATSLSSVFNYSTTIKYIEEVVFNKNASITSILSGVTKLEYIRFSGTIGRNGLDLSSCGKLTAESLVSALEALADYSEYTGTTVYKITIGSTNKAKLTAEQLAIATNKGWTVV